MYIKLMGKFFCAADGLHGQNRDVVAPPLIGIYPLFVMNFAKFTVLTFFPWRSHLPVAVFEMFDQSIKMQKLDEYIAKSSPPWSSKR
jgi:hypothetical protein